MVVVAPLAAANHLMGALQAERFEGAKPFDEVDVLVCDIVAKLLASSMDGARMRAKPPRPNATPHPKTQRVNPRRPGRGDMPGDRTPPRGSSNS
jgi:hypothetical protein